MMMMEMSLQLLLLGLAMTSTAAAQGSCVGRCGELFARGRQCTCDFNCLQYNECCSDFKSTCTTTQSCQGRCGETFKRGQPCDCDLECVRYNTCCQDHQFHCDAHNMSAPQSETPQALKITAAGNQKPKKNKKKINSESEEQHTGLMTPTSSSGPTSSADPTNQLRYGAGARSSAGDLLSSTLYSAAGAPHSPSPAAPLPGYSSLSQGNQYRSHQGPAGSRLSTLDDVAAALGLPAADLGSEQPGAGLFPDLCSDAPISGLTSLGNGTVLIFKGAFFWSVDPVSRSAGPPQSITDTLGIPSPIDTVFTRCNCNRNTYIVKGDRYWRLDGNMVVEPGFPKPLSSEFPGLTGPIQAALPVPAAKGKPEAVHFFKNGDIMKSFTFPPASTRSCNANPRSSMKKLPSWQAVPSSGEINIKLSLKSFPSPVTSALSMPSPQRRDKFFHYIFSGPLFFMVQISGDLLELAAKIDPSAPLSPLPIINSAAAPTGSSNTTPQDASSAPPANSIIIWLKCF